MGFSPLEGLVMATRCGDIDPGLLLYLQRSAGLDAATLDELLNQRSGLLGVSGLSGDMRRLLSADTPSARLAVAVYCYRLRKYIGAYMMTLGGADAILFGGGVGENAPAIRRGVLESMHWCGIELDASRNEALIAEPGCISTPASKVSVWVIPADEARILAEQAATLQAVGKPRPKT
jgi:acetate kinase